MFSKVQCPNSRSILRKRRQMRVPAPFIAIHVPSITCRPAEDVRVSAICFTLNPKGHHLRHLGHTCSSIRSKATWVMVIHQFYGYMWHLPQIRTLTPLHHECEDWYLDVVCSMQYALCQNGTCIDIGQERSTWTHHLTSLQPGMVPDRKAWAASPPMGGILSFQQGPCPGDFWWLPPTQKITNSPWIS